MKNTTDCYTSYKTVKMKLGKHLRKKRYEKRLSQQEVADHLCVSQRTYSNYESDNTTPSIVQLLKIGELLEFDFLKCFKT